MLAALFLHIIYAKGDLRYDLQKRGLNVGHDFYVILVNPDIASTTNGCVVYSIYSAIRQTSKSQEIVFMFKKEGYDQKYLIRYTREVLKIRDFPAKNAKICINDELYNRYKKYGWYSELIYYSDRMLYDYPAKFVNLSIIKNFPVSKVDIEYAGAIMLDTGFLHTRRDIFCQYKNRLVQVSDNNFRTGYIDSTGKLSHYFIWDTIVSPLELYKKYRNPSTEEIQTAIQYNDYKQTNRPEVIPTVLFSTKQNLYIPFSIGIMERRKESYVVAGGGNFKKEIKKGQLEGNLYYFMMRFDSSMKKNKIIDLNKPLFEIYHSDDLAFESMYTPNDTTFYIYHEYSDDFKDKPFIKKSVSRFVLVDNELKFDKMLDIPPVVSANNLDVSAFFTPFANDLLLCRSASREIYSVNKEMKVAELSGLAENKDRIETYPKYIDDTAKYNLAYEVLATKNINNKYFVVVYKNFGQVLLEVFDEHMSPIQLIYAPIRDDNQVGGYAIYENYLLQLKFTNGKAYLLKYKITEL